MTTIRNRYQYRINKKGCECFRTWSRQELIEKLAELKAKHPNVAFTTQSRSYRVNQVGAPLDGVMNWTSWS